MSVTKEELETVVKLYHMQEKKAKDILDKAIESVEYIREEDYTFYEGYINALTDLLIFDQDDFKDYTFHFETLRKDKQ